MPATTFLSVASNGSVSKAIHETYEQVGRPLGVAMKLSSGGRAERLPPHKTRIAAVACCSPLLAATPLLTDGYR